MAAMNLPGLLRPARAALLIGLAVFVLGGIFWRTGLLQEPELWFYDHFVQWRSNPNATDSRIMLVELTERDINQLDYPLRDTVLAEVLQKIESGTPNVVGVDLYRDLPEPRDHSGIAILNQTLQKYPNIVCIFLTTFLKEHPFLVPPPPGLKGDSSRFGFNNFIDGKILRRAVVLWPNDKNYQGDIYFSFAVQLAQNYLASKNIDIAQVGAAFRFGKTIIPVLDNSDGGYVNDAVFGYAFLQDFRGPEKFDTLSVADVLALKDPSVFKDRIVLLGISAGSNNDTFITPVSGKNPDGSAARIPGVLIHAQIVNQLLRIAINGDKPTTSLSQIFGWLFLAYWSVVGVVVGLYTKSHHVFALMIALCLGAIVLTGWLFFLQGYWILVFAPIIVFGATAGLVKGYAATHEEEQRKMLMKLFSQRVNPAVAEEIWNNRDTFLEGGRPATQKLIVTALFTDLKNYSTISEGMTPAELIAWVNDCQAALSKHVQQNGGMVLCFMGDGMMAVFGAPLPRETEDEMAADAAKAVRSALGMGDEIRRMNAEWKAQGKPLAGLRIGIFTGEAVAGDLGTHDYLEYSVIGDTINTASRLESVDKEGTLTKANAEVRILIGARTYRYISNQFPSKHVGYLNLKGKTETTEIYKVLDCEDEPQQPKGAPR
jgi:adenylate cyclase